MIQRRRRKESSPHLCMCLRTVATKKADGNPGLPEQLQSASTEHQPLVRTHRRRRRYAQLCGTIVFIPVPWQRQQHAAAAACDSRMQWSSRSGSSSNSNIKIKQHVVATVALSPPSPPSPPPAASTTPPSTTIRTTPIKLGLAYSLRFSCRHRKTPPPSP